jgi:NAD(P)-dependent dehydrogenase (short-subunit alcohol dehydrogenase family)
MGNALAGKVTVITGGCSGIGAAAVDLFEREGASVIIADLQVAAGERRAAASPSTLRFIRCDVVQETDIALAVGLAMREFGGLDILFNNAGAAGTLAPIATMDSADWDAIMGLITRAAMLGMKHAVPFMRQRGAGSIINTASIAGLRPGIAAVGYSVAKAALIQLTRMAAVEFACDNIRVNAICPGVIPTQALGGLFGTTREATQQMLPEVAKIFADAQPLKRSGTPEDIAQTALFLASNASSFTTGQEFVVDGGMMLMGPGTLELGRAGGVMQRIAELAVRKLQV